jgi:RimJ/RimL family protein N-acetyltransferase
VTGVRLVPVPHAVAVAVTTGRDVDAALQPLTRAPDWPHDDTADALRPHAEHGGPGPATGTFLVVEGDRVVGDCGWFGPPDASGTVEIGYGLAASARGGGRGSAAVTQLLDWVATQPGVRRVVAEALVGNEPSRHLLLRLGFAEEPATPPYRRYGRDVPPWTGTSESG